MSKKYSKVSLVVMFLKGNVHYFAVSILAALLVTGLDMIMPQLIRTTVDSIIGTKALELPKFLMDLVAKVGGVSYFRQNICLIGLLIVIIAIFNAIFRYIFNLYNTKGAEALVKNMRNRLFSHIQRLPFSWHMKNQTGDIIQRCTSDVDTVKNFLSEQLTGILQIVMQVGTSMWMMFSMNPSLALISAATMPVILLYSSIFGRNIGEGFRKCDEAEGQLSACAQENLTGV